MIVNCFEKKVEVVLGYAASLVHNWLTSYQFMLIAVAVVVLVLFCIFFLLIFGLEHMLPRRVAQSPAPIEVS